jgi:hypothetical protein
MRVAPRLLLMAGVVAACFLAGLYWYSSRDDGRLHEFELRAGLPRCFQSPDLGSIAATIAPPGIRCRPVALSFAPGDPLPEKLLCMPASRFAEEGPYVMKPPVLILTAQRGCIVAVSN